MYDELKIGRVQSLFNKNDKENNMNKTLKIMLSVAIVAMVCLVCKAFAASDGNFIDNAVKSLGALFQDVRTIIYVLGAFALVGFAWLAIMGNLAWKKVAILAVGLAVLAIADQVVRYAVGVKDDPLSPSDVEWDEGL